MPDSDGAVTKVAWSCSILASRDIPAIASLENKQHYFASKSEVRSGRQIHATNTAAIPGQHTTNTQRPNIRLMPIGIGGPARFLCQQRPARDCRPCLGKLKVK
jgi:hypothetical protein